LAKEKPEVSPERAAQAEKMKALLEKREAERKEREAEKTKGAAAGGGWAPGGVDARQTRSGRRGNR
jgi:hypothetical protein